MPADRFASTNQTDLFVQRQHTRILILVIIILAIICFILMQADQQMDALDQQMPVVGCTLNYQSQLL
jgi:hypothetical protein